jgi:hypothetical protein
LKHSHHPDTVEDFQALVSSRAPTAPAAIRTATSPMGPAASCAACRIAGVSAALAKPFAPRSCCGCASPFAGDDRPWDFDDCACVFALAACAAECAAEPTVIAIVELLIILDEIDVPIDYNQRPAFY